MAKPDDAPVDPILKEAELRDAAARSYCDRLAQQIKTHHATLADHTKPVFAQSWRLAFHSAAPELHDSVAEANISKSLYTDPRAQARMATLIEYPPSKWLLEQELAARGSWPPADPAKDAYAVADELRLAGLCFSGGGIRSATFNLGVLQGLAVSNRLNSFDYLSTVSGGGYIHQFLASWISCEDIEKVRQQLQPLPGPPSQRGFWPEPLRWLRRFSNYLTPRTGLFAADTWVAFAVWARNTFLNQIVLIASILLVLLLPHFYLSSRGRVAHFLLDRGLFTAAIIMAGFLFASGIIFFTQILHPPADHCHPVEETGFGQAGVLGLVFVPILMAVFAFCPYLYRSSFWAGNLLPQTTPHTAAELRHWSRVHRVLGIVAWPENTGIVSPSTRVQISHLHRLARTPEKPATTPPTDKPSLPPPGEPNAMNNLRVWQSTYSFRWWKPIGGFDDDTSTSWVFTSMLAGIALLVLSGARAIPQNWRRLIVLLAWSARWAAAMY